ncbi:hypothetical protein [Bradyrhizobium sp. NP1]|uniref:hypothetical protein n=1 Tax=Bradyrhizobium sp. NP1 TaxID=3049772 RepID=UPI0025A5C7D7|nr:hypothetical protein [Bradyrhizobium sp. NP1]WJR82089.1 hypothetical protein QOU61_08870 [Bradyrhizobium sp. NP1]
MSGDDRSTPRIMSCAVAAGRTMKAAQIAASSRNMVTSRVLCLRERNLHDLRLNRLVFGAGMVS